MIFVLTVPVMPDNIYKTETFPFEPIIPLFSDSVNHKIFTFQFLQNSVKYSSFIGKYSLAKYHKCRYILYIEAVSVRDMP